MKIRLSPQARADLRAIREHYLGYSRLTADTVRQSILQAIELVAVRPMIGIQDQLRPGVLSKLVARYPYRIHYVLEVLHIRHTARRPWHEGTE
jgi:plasmid stabilization system protein ParE